MTPRPAKRELPPDWFCEGQEDLLDLIPTGEQPQPDHNDANEEDDP